MCVAHREINEARCVRIAYHVVESRVVRARHDSSCVCQKRSRFLKFSDSVPRETGEELKEGKANIYY